MHSQQDFHSIFQNGSTWLRADFHLHTNADKEFKYTAEDNAYVSKYIAGLKKANIQLGAITNHNKFDHDEFKILRKKARKEDIFLLPGVELSLNDGANGIHTLIVFSEEWIENGIDYITPFISGMFIGRAEIQYQSENGRSDKNILQVVEELEKTSKDYFIIFAHVEQKSGLWYEMSGGKIGDIASDRYSTLRERTLAFQKVRTFDEKQKVKQWLNNWYPAEVEGSDCKSVNDIGKGQASYIKLGAFSFDSVKFALKDYHNRIHTTPSKHTHSHIKKIHFEGGMLSGKDLLLSPELNTLIGIRGSGKSSLLEVLRYALEIPFGKKAGDIKYKEKLVGFTMGSGGKIEIDAVDRYGAPYVIRRIWKEKSSEVLINSELQAGISIRETVIHKPIYFGQKDLSSTGEGFEKDLVEKLVGSKLDGVRQRIATQKSKVTEAIKQYSKATSIDEQIADHTALQQDTTHRLKLYNNYGIKEKLQKQLDFENDLKKVSQGIEFSNSFISDLQKFVTTHEEQLNSILDYTSKHNQPFFKNFFANYKYLVNKLDQIKSLLNECVTGHDSLEKYHTKFIQIKSGMLEEFSETKRKIGEELKVNGIPNITSDDFITLQKKFDLTKERLSALEKQQKQQNSVEQKLIQELATLNSLWHEEFMLINTELNKIEETSDTLSISSKYKEDKQKFLEHIKTIFKGSGIRESTYKKITNNYQDFIAIFKDFKNAKKLFGSNPDQLTNLFMDNLEQLLTYQVPNEFIIKYRGKELENHSLGQRASALILFVLSQRDNDVVIIDQPEDDLDNQTIYEDVIKLIRQMKKNVQFIFATHNPNIPVLGDAEQVHACAYDEQQFSIVSGSVDNSSTQKTIVDIMEGGEEAFNRRKEIYQIWKP